MEKVTEKKTTQKSNRFVGLDDVHRKAVKDVEFAFSKQQIYI